MILQDKTEEFEICGCGCGNRTSVRKDTPVDQRGELYIEGAGQQLRPECYRKIYGPSSVELSQARIQLHDLGILV